MRQLSRIIHGMNRTPPAFVGDNFDDNSFDTAKWLVIKTDDAAFSESSQRLNITPGTNNNFNKSALFVYKKTIDPYGKEMSAVLNITPPVDLSSNEGLSVYLGLVPAATAALGSFGNLADDFTGIVMQATLQNFNNHLNNIKFFWFGSDTGNIGESGGAQTGVTQPTRGFSDPWPIGMRLAFVGQNMIGYLMEAGSSTWTQIFSHAFSSTSLAGLRLAIGMQTTSPSTIGQNAAFESVTSTIPA